MMNVARAFSGYLLIIYHVLTSVHCYVNGDIKLNEIVKRIEYVQVYVNDVSVPICWESHTRDDVANTICRQLGLNGAKNTSSRSWKSGSHIAWKVVYINSCKNDATHIFQCSYNVCESTNCCSATKKVLAVTCNTEEYVYEGQLSLVMKGSKRIGERTKSNSQGKLRVYLNGNWTFVCNKSFGYDEAECSCKQLGYTGHSTYFTLPNVYGSQKMMWIGTNSYEGRLNCSGSEVCLTDCYLKPKNKSRCTGKGRVYLKCDYNMSKDNKNATGSESLCTFNKKTTGSSTGGVSTADIAGIIAGSLLVTIICICGVCCGIYFSGKAKKPHCKRDSSVDPDSSVKLNYSAVYNSDGTCTDSEQEEKFDHPHYQPPTPLLQNDEMA